MSAENKGPIYTLFYVAVISAVFTGGIMALYAVSKPTIQRNAALFQQKALVDALNLGDVDVMTGPEIAAIFNEQVRKLDNVTDPETGAVFEVYASVDETGKHWALAFTISGTGFWARIDGFLAVTPELDTVVGITFLKHQETPGLGGRITERGWRETFRGLDVSEPADGKPTMIIIGDAPADQAARRVDAISGATGTSSAVEVFLNDQIAAFRRAWQAEVTE
jgi:Na+-transporting NADH:ubiquinone oxidoreductase subunit C